MNRKAQLGFGLGLGGSLSDVVVTAIIKFEWQCGGPAGKTTMPGKYRPKDCR